jgi:hypothetical protein
MPSYDVALSKIENGLNKLINILVEPLVERMPIMSPEFDIMLHGQKSTTIFYIDFINGRLFYFTSIIDNTTDLLTLVHCDYTLKAVDGKRNKTLWNFTVYNITFSNILSDRGMNIVNSRHLREDVEFEYAYTTSRPIKIYQKNITMTNSSFINAEQVIITIILVIIIMAIVILVFRLYKSNLILNIQIRELKQQINVKEISELSTNVKSNITKYNPIFRDNFEGDYYINIDDVELDFNNFDNNPFLHENFVIKGNKTTDLSSVTECIIEQDENIIKKTEFMKMVSFYKKEKSNSSDNVVKFSINKPRENILNFQIKANKVDNVCQISVRRHEHKCAIKELKDLYQSYVNENRNSGRRYYRIQ